MRNGEQEFLYITREQNIISQVIQTYKDPMFDIRNPLSVQFRISGPAQLGVDTGGATTEYFYYLMKELERRNLNGVQLLEGEPGHLVPRFDYDLVSGNMMKLVRRIDSAFHPEQL